MKGIHIDVTPKFKPGDKPPKDKSAYLAWHEWARVQYKAGFRQARCPGCGKCLFPQEVEDHRCELGKREGK